MSFGKGWGSLDGDVRAQQEERARKMVTRFRVKVGETRTIIFLDEDPTVIEEYTIEGADWRDKDYVTKPKSGTDRFAAIGLKPTTMYVWSILDVTRDKDGKPGEFKRLLAVKPEQAKLLYEKAKNWQGLLHKPVRVSRAGQFSSSSGSDFELILINGAVTKADVSRYKSENRAPFDYATVLSPPKDDEQIRLLAKAKQSRGAAESVPLGDIPPAGDANGSPFGGAGEQPPAAAGVLNDANSDIPF